MILRSILIKVFQTAESGRNLLHLVKDYQRVIGCNRYIGINFQPHDNSLYIQI